MGRTKGTERRRVASGKTRKNGRKRSSRMRVTRENRITMLIVTGVVLLLFIVLAVQSCHLRKQIHANESENVRLNSQIKAEKERTKSIESLREQMSSDEYIEQEARERLGLAESDEILFRADDS